MCMQLLWKSISAFRDSLCLRYGWYPSNLPLPCSCGKQFSVEHALSCSHGGYSIYPSQWTPWHHCGANEWSLHTELPLQPITDEHLIHRTVNKEGGTRLDVAADSFWGNDRQRTFFDVRVFNPLAPSYQNTPLAQCYRRNEQEKQAYDQRVREIEHGSFSPLVFTTTGGMGTVATVVYKRLAAMIAEKRERPYSKTMQWIRHRLNFSLLHSSHYVPSWFLFITIHPSCHHISRGRVPIQVWTVLHWNRL